MEQLIGKKIVETKTIYLTEKDYDLPERDDEYTLLILDNGEQYVLEPSYGGYTGLSRDEYPVYIIIHKYEDFVKYFNDYNIIIR